MQNGQRTSGFGPALPGAIFGTGPDARTIEPIVDPRWAQAQPQDNPQPFVVLDDTGIFSRVLLVRVQSQNGRTALAALKIQKDIPAVPAARGFGRSFTNLDAIAEFEREAECRLSLGGDPSSIVPLPQVPVAERLPIVSLPVTYCKKTRQFFHPVCPDCGEFLHDCRDENLLGRSGLPSFANSARRVLYCAACAAKSGAMPAFYAAAPLHPTGSTPVRLRVGTELYRDWARLAASAGQASAKQEQERPDLKQFACLNCPHRAACYPARPDETRSIPAEKLLYPLAYYEFCAIPRELFALHYDEFMQLLGGRSVEDIKAAVARRIPAELLGECAAALTETRTEFPAYLRSGADGSPSAAEVLWLKLGAFEQLCVGLLRVYEHCRRPHLDLQPRSVMVSPAMPAAHRPMRWFFNMGILNPAAAVPVQGQNNSGIAGQSNFLSQPYFSRLYTSPHIRRQPYGHEEYANVTVRAVTSGAAESDIRFDLVSEVISVLGLAAHDRLRVSLNVPGSPLDGFSFWAEVVGSISDGLQLVGRIGSIQPGVADALSRAVGQTLWDCRANICRTYDVRCDIYSLGMMLLCSLLANDEQDETKVCLAVEDLGRRLAVFARAQGRLGRTDLDQELRRLLAEAGPAFAPEAVLYRAEDRRIRVGDLSAGLWFGCQQLAFSMTTEIAGFSICGGSQEVGSAEDTLALKSVLERLKDLNLWAEGRLFAGRALRRELDLAYQVQR